jgi:hypothetical protein
VLKAVRAHTETGLRATGAARNSERVACENMVELVCNVGTGVLCDESLLDNCIRTVFRDVDIFKDLAGFARLKLPMVRRSVPRSRPWTSCCP